MQIEINTQPLQQLIHKNIRHLIILIISIRSDGKLYTLDKITTIWDVL